MLLINSYSLEHSSENILEQAAEQDFFFLYLLTDV